MLQDLHAHTYYSFCGGDTPESIVEAAIDAGLEVFGITDHNYGVNYLRVDLWQNPTVLALPNQSYRTFRRYYDHMRLIRDKYADRIRVMLGIEICTLPDSRYHLPEDADVSFFDYALVESLDSPGSLSHNDLFAYAKRLGTPTVGVAHTDLFGYIRSRGEDPLAYLKRMAEENIFWEMNVSYDPIHKFRVHQYMVEFFQNKEQQDIVRESGVKVSVGFDGHQVQYYLPERVCDYCRQLEALGIPQPFDEK